MKNLFHLFIVFYCVAGLIACKKDSKSKPPLDSGFYPVSFNLSTESGLTSNSLTSKTKLLSLKTAATTDDTVQYLQYLVYNSSRQVIRRVIQSSYLPSFGHIKDSLQAGNYTVAMVMGRAAYIQYDSRIVTTNDAFFKKFPLVVSNSAINSTAVLPRIVTKLEVNLEDAIPAAVNKIVITIDKYNTYYSIWDETPGGPESRDFVFQITSADIGIVNKKFDFINLNTTAPFKVTIKATGPNSYSATKIVNNVVCTKNSKTTLTGTLFDVGIYPNTFTVKIDDKFSSDTTRVGF